MGSIDTPKSSSIFLQIIENPDGSVRRPVVPLVPPTGTGPSPKVLAKDVPLDAANGTWLRLYLPNPPPPETKLPVILYFHGGGFVVFSPDFLLYHSFCEQTAAALPALVVSLHYRLAPEHRLPAAYDDAVDALRWLRSSADPWIASRGDLSRCFLAGSSSGGNIAYHAGLRASSLRLGLEPLKLAGVVMVQPFLGGEERTGSEEGVGGGRGAAAPRERDDVEDGTAGGGRQGPRVLQPGCEADGEGDRAAEVPGERVQGRPAVRPAEGVCEDAGEGGRGGGGGGEL
ncbi:putative carboxylesterase 8 [Iris pallida]|uniref:Carboxylesterase 8 n=1 Tax=Iris pallida TaxID=29817 RepID=A0AAX6E8B4_IRIPA|nr:putative carboxylesterase 8 [Iris pallida]